MSDPIHVLTGEELSAGCIEKLIEAGFLLKKSRRYNTFDHALKGQHLALIFDKPSLRTRFSFTVAMVELGGQVIESIGNTRKTESPEDQARVLSGYCHGIMVRTHQDEILTRMAKVSRIPIINGLSDLHHPCQVLADLMTLQEVYGKLEGLTLSYIGDGNNILNSLLLLAPQLGIKIHYACPKSRQPDPEIAFKAKQFCFSTPEEAVAQAHAVYTDTWSSMGFENQAADHLFEGFQVNEQLMNLADPKAVFMHCLPLERGKEVNHTLPDSPRSVIFQQSENRLHIQKALLLHCLRGCL